MGAVEHLGDGGGVVVPAGEAVDVDLAELPLLQGVALALQELAQLLGAADGEPDLDQDDAVGDQHVLELRRLVEEAGALRVGAPAEDVLDHGAVVPGAVVEHHLAAGRQVVDVALEVPLAALGVAGRRQRDDAGAARVEVLGQRPDGAALAGGVAALEHHDDAPALGAHPGLRLHELELAGVVGLLVFLLVQPGPVGVAGVEDVVLAGVLQDAADILRRALGGEAADRAAERQAGILFRHARLLPAGSWRPAGGAATAPPRV